MSIIFSLDIPFDDKSAKLINSIKPFISVLKINHLHLSQELVSQIGKKLPFLPIFLDVKLYDIPNTTKLAIQNYEKNIPNLKYITIHGNVDKDIIETALSSTKNINIISVIQLTSTNISHNKFLAIAKYNYDLGIRNFIVPAPMIQTMKKNFASITIFTPGIRDSNYLTSDDQKTVGTPALAKKYGANFIIVGRPIYKANDPILATKKIYQDFHES
ncbi:orotidine-5'-phosphate decarboxylase [Candidatus Hepatincola sp. Av]